MVCAIRHHFTGPFQVQKPLAIRTDRRHPTGLCLPSQPGMRDAEDRGCPADRHEPSLYILVHAASIAAETPLLA